MQASVVAIWNACIETRPAGLTSALRSPPLAWHFGDNPADADQLAALTLSGKKRATAPSLWQFLDVRLPQVGDFDVVTYWSGDACCVIRTVRVEIVPFAAVSAEFAAREGEGDGSLSHWRRIHWRYFRRVLAAVGRAPSLDMPVVCQSFDRVYP